jgi:3-dehydroquinate dehydratase-2
MYDFEFIVICKNHIGIGRLRHDFSIAFNRDLALWQLQVPNQAFNSKTVRQVVMIVAINDKVHESRPLVRRNGRLRVRLAVVNTRGTAGKGAPFAKTVMTATILFINGPNLNLLGTREPEVYGSDTLADIEARCKAAAPGAEIRFTQSNIEGELVDFIQEGGREADVIIINPAAYTHTSIALYDAIKAIETPVIEIHLSQPASRESFRRRSYVAEAAVGTISGFGANSYLLGLQAAMNLVKARG